jgi:hypothetical protein
MASVGLWWRQSEWPRLDCGRTSWLRSGGDMAWALERVVGGALMHWEKFSQVSLGSGSSHGGLGPFRSVVWYSSVGWLS